MVVIVVKHLGSEETPIISFAACIGYVQVFYLWEDSLIFPVKGCFPHNLAWTYVGGLEFGKPCFFAGVHSSAPTEACFFD